MANLVLVLGKTSSGKSRSIKNLDPTKTYIINILGKDLPFKKGRTDYNRDKKNMKQVGEWDEVLKLIGQIPVSKPEVNSIIIDDARYIMENEFIKRATEVGYNKFVQLGQHMAQILELSRNIGDKNLDIFMMLHTDDIMNGTNIVSYKAKLVGKLVEDHFDPMEQVTICLFTNVVNSQSGTAYQFITNKTNIDGIMIPAKSPEEMFPLIMDNDLQLVKEHIQKYYKED